MLYTFRGKSGQVSRLPPVYADNLTTKMFFRPNHASEGGDDKEGKRVDIFLPSITTSFAAYFPQYFGYYYPWYTYGTEFNFPFYSSFKGYPQVSW